MLRYLREAAEALDMMNHQHQLQHLDIKPQNLFLIHDHVKVAETLQQRQRQCAKAWTDLNDPFAGLRTYGRDDLFDHTAILEEILAKTSAWCMHRIPEAGASVKTHDRRV